MYKCVHATLFYSVGPCALFVEAPCLMYTPCYSTAGPPAHSLLRRPASGHCLCNGRRLGRRPFPATAALSAAPALCNGRRLRCRSCSVTAAASAAARFLFVPSELPPLGVPVLRPALLCGPFFLSTLNCRAANCPRTAAPCHVSAECPAALFYISAQPKPSMFG
jgi:hypothetical protein